MTARIHDTFEMDARRRGVWPLRKDEQSVPDEWLALLDQLHGQAESEPAENRG